MSELISRKVIYVVVLSSGFKLFGPQRCCPSFHAAQTQPQVATRKRKRASPGLLFHSWLTGEGPCGDEPRSSLSSLARPITTRTAQAPSIAHSPNHIHANAHIQSKRGSTPRQCELSYVCVFKQFQADRKQWNVIMRPPIARGREHCRQCTNRFVV